MTQYSLDDVFRELTDFGLCDAISCAVDDHYGHDVLMAWPNSIPVAHKLPHYVWLTTGYLEGEGLARFFNLKCNHLAYPECFEILGMPVLAADIRKLLRLFPQSDLGDTDALISHFGTWKKIEELVDDTESKLYAQSEAIEAALTKYIRQHKSEYEPLLPEILKTRACESLVKKSKRH